ncbi:hypothetical protein An02g04600 [Aspergillus niger]|uniref:F-box domain-containing protein n=2 Tax=Aspergillus niger TaxID=5061 RepID=A2QCS8_ASPNC|nr:hypothetical protein An02g04600 [Aspergillus niger]CAK37600.1 hypothetical protein An02g04600 [Aspergillus niger]
MTLPTEILRLIIQHLLPQLHLPELLRARKVNSLFDEEIITFLLNGKDLEDLFTFLTRSDLDSSPWGTFPDRLKRLYLYRKLREHPQKQCAFTCFVQEVIEYQLGDAPAEEEKIKLTESLIDVAIAGKNDPSTMFHPLHYGTGWTQNRYVYDLESFQWMSQHKEGTERSQKLWWSMDVPCGTPLSIASP